jgi:hypothetical protein
MAELCSNCGNYFASPSTLVVHVKEAHAGETPVAGFAMTPEADRTFDVRVPMPRRRSQPPLWSLPIVGASIRRAL